MVSLAAIICLDSHTLYMSLSSSSSSPSTSGNPGDAAAGLLETHDDDDDSAAVDDAVVGEDDDEFQAAQLRRRLDDEYTKELVPKEQALLRALKQAKRDEVPPSEWGVLTRSSDSSRRAMSVM